MDLYLHAMGHFHPETVLDNAFFESLDIGTSDEWIFERVGIRERRTILPLDYIRLTRNRDLRAADEAALCSPLEMARRAALLALQRAGLRASDIGLVVAGGCCPSMNLPSDAARLAESLGISAPTFDLNAGCATFGTQLHVLRSMGHACIGELALVVNSEATTRVVDYSDRGTAVLWGDGASAAIVSTKVPSRVRISDSGVGGDPGGASAIGIPRFGYFSQRGSAVQRFAIKTMLSCLSRSLAGFQRRPARARERVRFIGHQANRTALESVRRAAGLGEEELWQNVQLFGNTGASGAPSVLSQNWEALASGDLVPLVVVGAGLSWAWLELEIQ